jgi:methionyl-tRNA formyltransferase
LETKLAFERTCKDLIEWMKIHGPKFLNSMLWKFGKKILGHRAQDEKKATYCSKIEKESGLIDIQKDPLELVYSKYRGFFLWPKIYFIFDGKRVIVEELVLDEKLFAKNSQLPLVNQDFSLNLAVVNCVVKPEGKKVMGWEEFKRGYVK